LVSEKPTDARGIANVRPDLFGKELDEFLKGKAHGWHRGSCGRCGRAGSRTRDSRRERSM